MACTSNNELKIKKAAIVRVYGPNSIACQISGAAILLSIQSAEDVEELIFNDVLLTREQAESLIESIKERLEEKVDKW